MDDDRSADTDWLGRGWFTQRPGQADPVTATIRTPQIIPVRPHTSIQSHRGSGRPAAQKTADWLLVLLLLVAIAVAVLTGMYVASRDGLIHLPHAAPAPTATGGTHAPHRHHHQK
jgi:hypothetical protein